MKILAVCGFGVGSSMILKLSIDKAAKQLGMKVDCENADIATALSIKADAVFTSPSLIDNFSSIDIPVIAIKKYIDVEEIKRSLKKLKQTLERS